GVVDVGLFPVGKPDLMPIIGRSGTGQHRSPRRLLQDGGAKGRAATDVGPVDRHLQLTGGGLDLGSGTAFFSAMDVDGSPRRDQIVQFDDVLVMHADTAVGNILSDAARLVGPVNAVGSPVVPLDA